MIGSVFSLTFESEFFSSFDFFQASLKIHLDLMPREPGNLGSIGSLQ